MNAHCRCPNLTGAWKGFRCGATPTLTHKGKPYCASHFAVVTTDPERIEKVKRNWEKRWVKDGNPPASWESKFEA
jgi:hypothetical protein